MIGYPDYILDPEKLDEKYRDVRNKIHRSRVVSLYRRLFYVLPLQLDIKDDAFFQNNLNDQMRYLSKNLVDLRKPPRKDEFVILSPHHVLL